MFMTSEGGGVYGIVSSGSVPISKIWRLYHGDKGSSDVTRTNLGTVGGLR
jgi:hypothetical protein